MNDEMQNASKENTTVGFIVRDNEHNKLLNRKN